MKLTVWPLKGSGTLLKQHCSITLTTALVPISGLEALDHPSTVYSQAAIIRGFVPCQQLKALDHLATECENISTHKDRFNNHKTNCRIIQQRWLVLISPLSCCFKQTYASKKWLKKNDVWYTVWWKNNAVKKFLWIVSSLS